MAKDNKQPYTDEALTTLAKAAAQYVIAQMDGDKTGAAAEINKALVIKNNPNARKKS